MGLALLAGTLAGPAVEGASAAQIPAFAGCWSGETESVPPCESIADASAGGLDSGIDFPQRGVISSDGKSIYVVAADDASVASFKRRKNGSLKYLGCLTGETQTAAAADDCTAIPSATSGGGDSGLDFPSAVAISSDGKSVYVASSGDAAVARFKRNAKNGKLAYKGCVTGETATGDGVGGNGACESVATVSVSGSGSGLYVPSSLDLSPNGKSLYVTAQSDDAVARFARNGKTGAIAYKGCQTGNEQLGPAGNGSCALVPGATATGQNSGMRSPLSIALDRRGRSLYVTSQEDAAVLRFKRAAKSGKLTEKSCITGETETEAAAGCSTIPSATSGGTASGLSAPYDVLVSRDGRSLYVAAASDSAVAVFKRSTKTGSLLYRGCITGSTAAGPMGTDACAPLPHLGPAGSTSGLYSATALAESRNGKSLYVAANFDAAVARFARNTKSGAIKFKGCLTGATSTGPTGSGACDATPDATPSGDDSGLSNPRSIFLSPDGKSIYAVVAIDDAVARLHT
jgi:6-phosphogluconolactonase (cycloisomerase 2 family)